MRKFIIRFLAILVLFASSCTVRKSDYAVKVDLENTTIRGALRGVSAEVIKVNDFKGVQHELTPESVRKIKVYQNGLSTVGGIGVGAGIGLAGGLALGSALDQADFFVPVITITGAIGGFLGALIGQLLNTQMVLHVDQDSQKYRQQYQKLEKYVDRRK